jgi:hypothetical protein
MHRRRGLLVAVTATVLALGVAVPVARAVSGHRHEAAMRAELRTAFADIADPRWTCSSGEGSQGPTTYGCSPRDGAVAPTLDFEAFDEPVDLESTVADVRRRQQERAEEDHSGHESQATLLDSGDWVPDAGGAVWGSVSRWRFDYDQPGAGYPVYGALFRYADEPFGVTVYASSPEELDDVVGSLSLPSPAELAG